LIILGILAVLAYGGWTWIAAQVVDDHAEVEHGSEAIAARNCLDNNGPTKLFKEPNGRVHQICQDDTGNYDQVIRDNDGRWEEVTAFKPNPNGEGNTWNAIMRWLARKGATAWSGPK